MQYEEWKKETTHQNEQDTLLSQVVRENIRSIVEHRKEAIRRRNLQERVADVITKFSGSMWFVYLHILWFAAWIILNAGMVDLEPFDPFPYGLLTMVVSLEAIFLSTFGLISLNRMSELDKQRAELDLQINLLTERELTHVLVMLDEIRTHIGIEKHDNEELLELQQTTQPVEVLKAIEEQEREEAEGTPADEVG